MSLLLAEGHREARRYPVAMVWTEAALCRERFARAETTRALLVQAAIATAVHKDGAEHFNALLRLLNDGD